jgi:hypothetical protein
MPHGLDPAPLARGRFTGTPAGGLLDLRQPFGAELSKTAWDEGHHTPDLRAPRGRDGRHNIPRLGFHLYRLRGAHITGVMPRQFTSGATTWYTFDPSGRGAPLFARRTRTQVLSSGVAMQTSAVFQSSELASSWEEWSHALPWQVPAPIACRLLGDVAYQLDRDALAPIYASLPAAQRSALEQLYDLRILGEKRLRDRLSQSVPALTASLAAIRGASLAADCGKAALLHASHGSIRVLPDAANPLSVDVSQADNLTPPQVTWESWELLAIDPESGRFVLHPSVVVTDLLTDHVVGTPGSIGARSLSRSDVPWVDRDLLDALAAPVAVSGGGALPNLPAPGGVLEIDDNRSYLGAADFTNVGALIVRADDGKRPYVQLAQDWRFDADPAASEPTLVLDGLWLGAAGAVRDVVLAGSFRRVEVRACTLDPGGTAADGSPLPAVRIRVAGSVERLTLQSSILSAVVVEAGGLVERLEIFDSILDHTQPIDLSAGELAIERSTILGSVHALRLWASDSLFSADLQVVDTQHGCFRFSAAPQGSLVPHAYQSAFFADASALFVSVTFGEAGYGLLSSAPEVALLASDDDLDGKVSIHTGASNDGEMGAYNALLYPIKERALRTKVEEFLPFGLLPVFLRET